MRARSEDRIMLLCNPKGTEEHASTLGLRTSPRGGRRRLTKLIREFPALRAVSGEMTLAQDLNGTELRIA